MNIKSGRTTGLTELTVNSCFSALSSSNQQKSTTLTPKNGVSVVNLWILICLISKLFVFKSPKSVFFFEIWGF